jgi:hypothetical protein
MKASVCTILCFGTQVDRLKEGANSRRESEWEFAAINICYNSYQIEKICFSPSTCLVDIFLINTTFIELTCSLEVIQAKVFTSGLSMFRMHTMTEISLSQCTQSHPNERFYTYLVDCFWFLNFNAGQKKSPSIIEREHFFFVSWVVVVLLMLCRFFNQGRHPILLQNLLPPHPPSHLLYGGYFIEELACMISIALLFASGWGAIGLISGSSIIFHIRLGSNWY